MIGRIQICYMNISIVIQLYYKYNTTLLHIYYIIRKIHITIRIHVYYNKKQLFYTYNTGILQ